MSQELSDAEFLRRLASAIGNEFSQSDPKIARLRSIADRLERPAVGGTLHSRWYKDDDDRDFVLWSVIGIENDTDLIAALGCDPKDNMPVHVSLTPAKTPPNSAMRSL